MPETSITDPAKVGALTYLFVFSLSILGGIVRFGEFAIKHKKPMSWATFFEGMVSIAGATMSGFAAFSLGMSFEWDIWITITLVSAAAYQGGEFMKSIPTMINIYRQQGKQE